jgi:hypothetical protein
MRGIKPKSDERNPKENKNPKFETAGVAIIAHRLVAVVFLPYDTSTATATV